MMCVMFVCVNIFVHACVCNQEIMSETFINYKMVFLLAKYCYAVFENGSVVFFDLSL